VNRELDHACGNIPAGRIGMVRGKTVSERLVARVETEGVHLQVEDVAGDLKGVYCGRANQCGKSRGRTIACGAAGDTFRAGPNCRPRRFGDRRRQHHGWPGREIWSGVRTGGGQIDFGKCALCSRATGGGGIRIM